MKIDWYTKASLTVIAIALVCLCVEHAFAPASVLAQTTNSMPKATDSNGVVAVPVVVYGASKTNGLWVFTPKP
jgi:hypothetical protein